MAEQVTVGELLVRIRADATQLQTALDATQTSIVNVSRRATPSLRRVETAMRMVGVSAAGLPGPIGRVVGALSALLPGGLITAGILAAFGTIAIALRVHRRRVEEATKAQQKLNDELAKTGLTPSERDELVGGRRPLVSPMFGRRPVDDAAIRRMDPMFTGLQLEIDDIFRKAVPLANQLLELTKAWNIHLTAVQVRFAEVLAKMEKVRAVLRDIAGGDMGVPVGAEFGLAVSRDIGSIIANDANIQRIVKAFEQQRNAFVAIGQSIGFALQDGIYSILGGGNFFKGLFRSLLGIGIGALTSGIGGAITKTLTGGALGGAVATGSGINLGSMARDPNWQRLYRETQLVAASQGFRG